MTDARWSLPHFKAGASARRDGEPPQVNPWTRGTHDFNSWKAGYEKESRWIEEHDGGAETSEG